MFTTLLLHQRRYDFKYLFELSDYYDRNRDDYYAALRTADRSGDYTEWLVYFLGGFANQMWRIEERVKKLPRQAVEADPNHANHLRNYAVFLKNIHNDMDGAEELYKRAIEADPNNASHLGNYAGLLFGRGNGLQGLDLLGQAVKASADQHDPLLLECEFYLYANGPDHTRNAALSQMKELLAADVRSSGWDFSANIKRAELDGHPSCALLVALAAVISEEAPIGSLDGFEEWRNLESKPS
jgi:tetratricopeptide (TPR) repeat protein